MLIRMMIQRQKKKFQEIVDAQELLIDDEKRANYDDFGTDEEQTYYYGSAIFMSDIKNKVNGLHYLNYIIPDSNHGPHIILVVGLIPNPLRQQNLRNEWTSITKYFGSQGFKHGWLDAVYLDMLGGIRSKIKYLPSIILVYKEEVQVFDFGPFVKKRNLVHEINKHLNRALESTVVKLENSSMVYSFVKPSELDKPHVVYYSNDDQIPMWYLILASQNSDYQHFAYVHGERASIRVFKNGDHDSYKLVKLNPFNLDKIKTRLASLRYNSIAWIYSPSRFEDLCPKHFSHRSSTCAVLVGDMQSESFHQLKRAIVEEMRRRRFSEDDERLTFMHLDLHRQRAFVDSMFGDDPYDPAQCHVVLLRRRASRDETYVSNHTVGSADDVFEAIALTNDREDFELARVYLAPVVDEFEPHIVIKFLLNPMSFVPQGFENIINFFKDILLMPALFYLFICWLTKGNGNNDPPRRSPSTNKTYSYPENDRIKKYDPTLLWKEERVKTQPVYDVVLITDDTSSRHYREFENVISHYKKYVPLIPSVLDWSKHQRWCEYVLNRSEREEVISDVEDEVSDEVNGVVLFIHAAKRWSCVFRPPPSFVKTDKKDKEGVVEGSMMSEYCEALVSFLMRVREGQQRRVHFETWNFES